MSKGRKFDKKAFLEKHVQFQEDKIDYELEELMQMMGVATELFANDPILLELRAPIQIAGDTHGQVSPDLL